MKDGGDLGGEIPLPSLEDFMKKDVRVCLCVYGTVCPSWYYSTVLKTTHHTQCNLESDSRQNGNPKSLRIVLSFQYILCKELEIGNTAYKHVL